MRFFGDFFVYISCGVVLGFFFCCEEREVWEELKEMSFKGLGIFFCGFVNRRIDLERKWFVSNIVGFFVCGKFVEIMIF